MADNELTVEKIDELWMYAQNGRLSSMTDVSVNVERISALCDMARRYATEMPKMNAAIERMQQDIEQASSRGYEEHTQRIAELEVDLKAKERRLAYYDEELHGHQKARIAELEADKEHWKNSFHALKKLNFKQSTALSIARGDVIELGAQAERMKEALEEAGNRLKTWDGKHWVTPSFITNALADLPDTSKDVEPK